MRSSDRDPLLRLARSVSQVGIWFSGALMVGAAGLIGVDVMLRRFFDVSVGGADELSGYVLAIGSAFAFGACLLDRAHVRIDSVYLLLPRRVSALLDLLSVFVFTAFMGLLTWYGWGVLRESWSVGARSMSPLATPLVIPQALWVLGLVSVVLIGALLFLRAIPAFLGGRMAHVGRLVGYRTVGEELEEEMELEQALQRRSKR